MRVLSDQLAMPQTQLSGTVDLEPHRVSVPAGLREEIRSRWPEWITIALYAAVVAFAIPYHEPWVDEAQAWQLARSLPLVTLFRKYIRYEGSPGLWHLLLWILNRAHVSYSGMHWICGAIAVAAVSVLIFRSPFPRYLKLSLPFTYFLLFQYAVVARSYVLVPLLLFVIASLWKRNSPVVALLLGLLANVALHAAAVSVGLAILYAMERIREGDLKEFSQRRQLLLSAGVLLGLYLFALWTAWPPHDSGFSTQHGGSISFRTYAIVSLVWGLCQPWSLSILFWIAIGLCFSARHRFVYLLPVLLFACFSGAVYVGFWHAGLMVPVILCLLWITWPAPGCKVVGYEAIGRAAMVLLAGTQILWATYALAYDHAHAYSPDLAASKFLQPLVRDGATIAVTDTCTSFLAVGLLPYFDHNIFMNLQNPFWSWSASDPTADYFVAALRTQPRIVIVEACQPHPDPTIKTDDPKVEVLTRAGYRLTNVFCGAHPEGLKLVAGTCHLIFQHIGDSSRNR